MIQHEGQISDYILFIEKGLVRCFRDDNDREKTLWIMKENDIIMSVESFFTRQPAQEYMETLEPCILHGIRYKELQHAYTHYPQFNRHGRVILEKYYVQSLQRESMRQKPAYDRYEYLMRNQPELVGRVPDKYLASYLGISLSSFSYQKSAYRNRRV